ncbi:hypothetical protein VNO77_50923 [Canavalia gladiata]|uniref:Uncharacterized protein n=1 Tax=Canavalia gladiata TaxID=3824 RepID=A0AAN9PGD8_CANGL
MFSEIDVRTGRLAKLPFLLHLDAARGVLFCLDRSSLQPDRLLKQDKMSSVEKVISALWTFFIGASMYSSSML